MGKGKVRIEGLSVSKNVKFDQEQAALILTLPPVWGLVLPCSVN
jgi:hypothetical protein